MRVSPRDLPRRHVGGVHMTGWKVTLLATQWLLLSTQALPQSNLVKPTYKPGYPPEPYRRMPDYATYNIEWMRKVEILPPAEFDHDYTGDLKITRATPDEVREMCFHIAPERIGLACTVRAQDGSTCRVKIVSDRLLQAQGWSYEL